MTEAQELRSFAAELLEDAGVEVRDDGTFLWLRVPEATQASLDLPAQACLTFDPDRVGEFDAELVAPGSYVLEKLLGVATRRGRWDVVRWLPATGNGPLGSPRDDDASARGGDAAPGSGPHEPLYVFAFRTALTSDEKREGFHLIAVARDATEAKTLPWPLPEDRLAPLSVPGFVPDLEPAYRKACGVLAETTAAEREAFRKSSLTALEEEVRRVFRYFDGTVAEIREAAPAAAEDVVRAVEAERDRRLAEALERFEPHAVASLCSVRIVWVPVAEGPGGGKACRGFPAADALEPGGPGAAPSLTGA